MLGSIRFPKPRHFRGTTGTLGNKRTRATGNETERENPALPETGPKIGKCGALPDGFRLEVIERNTIFLKQKTGEAEEGATEVPDCKNSP